ncbi:hypothetical protein GQ53DRAFT_890331 [Thozetella sp. PMI_491]|nr:hypothetical protein GQ53DRAFT_890331 [Thozetella sp. PMI_491]
MKVPSTLPALLALGIIRLSVAQTGGTAFLRDGTPGYPPFGIEEKIFDKNMTHPNAVGNFQFVGSDISKPYVQNGSVPGVPIEGWSWQINATADVSLNSSRDTYDGVKYTNQFTAAARVALNFPRALLNHDLSLNISDDWGLCIRWWDLTNLPDDFVYPHQMRFDDGSCSSVLTKECINEIQNPTAQSHPSLLGCLGCPDLEQIQACKGSPISAFTGNCGGGIYSPENLPKYVVNGSMDVRSYADLRTYKKGDASSSDASYNNVATLALPIIVKFGSRYNLTGNGFTGGILNCPIPKNATEGSLAAVPPPDDPTTTSSATPSKTTSTSAATSSSPANKGIEMSGVQWWTLAGSNACMLVLAGYL